MSKPYRERNPEFGLGGNELTPPKEQRITEGMDHIPPSTISHEGGLPPLVFRTHIETHGGEPAGELDRGIPGFKHPEDLDLGETLRRIKEYLRQQPAPDDPDGKRVLRSRPEGPEQLPSSWVVLPPKSDGPFEVTRGAWETLQGAPASGEEDVDPAYSGLIEEWANRYGALGALGLQESEPQQELGDQ